MTGRRAVVAGLVAATALPGGGARAADQPRRLTKVEAHYQDMPKGILSCGLCSQFVAPNACKVLIGEVSAEGWCDLFEIVD